MLKAHTNHSTELPVYFPRMGMETNTCNKFALGTYWSERRVRRHERRARTPRHRLQISEDTHLAQTSKGQWVRQTLRTQTPVGAGKHVLQKNKITAKQHTTQRNTATRLGVYLMVAPFLCELVVKLQRLAHGWQRHWGGGIDGCARGADTSSSPSGRQWLQPHTTAVM